jgi:uncharacterized protein YlxW (UPF0749 family)
MSTNISPSARGRSWVFPVTALCIMLGVLLALALKTQHQAASEGNIPNRWPAVRTEFLSMKEQNDKLRKDLAEYRSREEEMARQQAQGLSTTKGLQRALDDAKALAGLVPLVGPGVVVTLQDSPQLPPSETRKDTIEQFMVHDSDLVALANELFNAGAEAVSVNGQRLIATSSIRCAGVPILVNAKRIAPPYVIKAIGSPAELESALKMQGGAADVAGLWALNMITAERKESIVIPAFDGSTRFTYAQPVKVKTSGNQRGSR